MSGSSPEVFLNGRILLHCGDVRDVIAAMSDCSMDSVVGDPPYALVSIVKRFGKTNAAPAQAGVDGLYARVSTGFMGKQWDTGEVVFAAGFWREVWRVLKPGGHLVMFGGTRTYHRMVVAIEDAGFEIRDQLAWMYGTGFPKSHNLSGDHEGWGTALKPAWEPIVLARKPLIGTVEANMRAHGTGALHVNSCRVGNVGGPSGRGASENSSGIFGNGLNGWSVKPVPGLGRWPANILHDGSDEVREAFPHSASESAARFFFSAKAGKADRLGSKHPTVKPVALMQWLVRLVTPAGGLILDPFAGTGTTGEAAWREGFRAVLIEREAEYQADIRRRMDLCLSGPMKLSSSAGESLASHPSDHGPLFGGGGGRKNGGELSTEHSPRTLDRTDRPQAMNSGKAAE